MQEFLFQITAKNPATFVGVAVLFIVVAFMACFISAARAIRIDPTEAGIGVIQETRFYLNLPSQTEKPPVAVV